MKISLSIGSDVLYHGTGLSAAVNILRSDRFELKPAEGTTWEEEMAGAKFYLSTARSKTSAYLKKSAYSYSVILKLDGRKLGHRYRIKAIDYWTTNREGADKVTMRTSQNEMEDRVLSDQQFIPRASQYISEVHACLNDKRVLMFDLKKMALLRKVKVYFYPDPQTLLKLDPARAVEVKFTAADLEPKREGPSEYTRKRQVQNFRNAFLRRWIELYKTPILTSVDDTVKKLHRDHGYRGYTILQYSDAINSFQADLHNAKSIPYGDSSHEREYLDELVQIMRKAKQTPGQFIKTLRDKWYPR